MLGSSLGFFSSRGMATVPNLSGLNRSQAEIAIAAAGLTLGSQTSTGSSVTSQDNIVSTQSVAAGQVVEYDTVVNFVYFTYVSPSPTPVVCNEISRQTYPVNWSGSCVGGQEAGSQLTEIDYSNCPTSSSSVTVYRSCGTTPTCTGSITETFNTCGTCFNNVQTCNYYQEISYSNCPSVVTAYSYTQSCGSAPAPTPSPGGTPTSPTPSVNWPPGAPANYCIDAETKIIIMGSNNVLQYIKAKDVNVGDYVLAMSWDELVDQDIQTFMSSTSANLTNIDLVSTMVVAKYEYEKPTTMYINNNIETRMSLEQPLLINRDGIWQWKQSGDIYIGDKFIQHGPENQVSEIEIVSVDYIQEMRDVYSFNCENTDTFFAGNILVHNK